MYYPKSQITPNLYTSGGEYMFNSTRLNYTGYYYKTSSGKIYTGKNPQDGPNQLLVPLSTYYSPEGEGGIDNPNIIDYIFPNVEESINFSYPYSSNKLISRSLPLYNPTIPTSKDQSIGMFTRYFCKKNNELKYIEIDKSTYDQLKARNPKIAWDLYTPLNVLWQIKGTKEQVTRANKSNIALLEQRQKWYGFSQYLKEDYLKYYVGV